VCAGLVACVCLCVSVCVRGRCVCGMLMCRRASPCVCTWSCACGVSNSGTVQRWSPRESTISRPPPPPQPVWLLRLATTDTTATHVTAGNPDLQTHLRGQSKHCTLSLVMLVAVLPLLVARACVSMYCTSSAEASAVPASHPPHTHQPPPEVEEAEKDAEAAADDDAEEEEEEEEDDDDDDDDADADDEDAKGEED
jgi:hypothetical protein